jgi:hypothetical protein
MPSYTYDIATETNNGKVNPDILAQQILDSSFPSGGTFEGVATEGGTIEDGGVINGGTLFISWQNALDAGDEAAQDALVAAHSGLPFGPIVQRISSEAISTTTLDTFQTKLSGSAQRLPAGKYLITAYCEIRLSALVANSGVRAAVMFNGIEVAEDNWGSDQWSAFSASGIVDIDAGGEPMAEILFRRIGAANTVGIRRARLTISQQSV